MSWSIEMASRFYDVPLVDYGSERLGGVLLCSGAGLMMAIMDATPVRWCVETDTLRNSSHLDDFMVLVAHSSPPLVVAGWFSLSSPDILRRGIAKIEPERRCVYSGAGIAMLCHGQYDDLGRFIEAVCGLCLESNRRGSKGPTCPSQ